ncbi:ATPase [Candidatus Gracilibacteria bacterium]|nr:ATPase [Candidatus Gracilibacteria bacterium]
MAQIPIREYDAKKMYLDSVRETYSGIQIQKLEDIEKLEEQKRYVIKPDMLFGKRGKRGLLGVNLDKSGCKNWLEKHFQKRVDVDGVIGSLDIFLVEEFSEIQDEYYVSFSQSREGDLVHFSDTGGIDIEENWESVTTLTIPVLQELNFEQAQNLTKNNGELSELILSLWKYYKSYGFVSLEFNPIARDTDGNFIILDAVAKVDDTEYYLQKNNWKNLEFPNSFGFTENAGEGYIRELDTQTGASLKLKILNPEARIWTLFAGGGGSLVLTDTLGHLGFASDIGNYGECSGNPSREFTREYTKTLLEQMLASSHFGKYLIIGGAIANFTYIDTTFAGVIDALEIYAEKLREDQVQILVRRGGINEKQGLELLQNACQRLEIPAIITGSDAYMTDILKEIIL